MKESKKLKQARRDCILRAFPIFWLLLIGIDIIQEVKEMWGDNNTLAVIGGFTAFAAIFAALLFVSSIIRRMKFFTKLRNEEMEQWCQDEESQAGLEEARKMLKKFKHDFVLAICIASLGIVVLPVAIIRESVLHIIFGVLFLILGIIGIIDMPKMVKKYKTLVEDKEQTTRASG